MNLHTTVPSDKYCTSALGKRQSENFGFVECYLCRTEESHTNCALEQRLTTFSVGYTKRQIIDFQK